MECNKTIVKMLNYNSKKEFLDTHPSQLSPEFQPDGTSSFDKANEMMAICLIEGFNEFDWIHTKSDGSNFWVRVTLNKINLNGNSLVVL